MAEYIKFRLTAAKVGVSMALLALVAGVAEKASSRPAVVKATPAASDLFLKLGGITGGVKTALVKLEDKWVKLDSSLTKIEHKLSGNYYDKHAVDGSFLKIKSANASFLKINDANAKFLKIEDAAKEYLPATGTAANASKLGGLTADAFVQGHGGVVSGAATIVPAANSPQTLLQIPNGTQGGIIVVCQPNPGGGVLVTINNGTGATLPAIMDVGGKDTPLSLGASTPLPIPNNEQFHLQTFPAGGFNNVLTLIVSVEITGNNLAVVGQAFTGGV